MKFGLAHCSLQPEQQPIIEVSRIVEAILVEDQRIGQCADLDQAMPVAAVSSESRYLKTHHDASLPETYFGNETLEAFAVGCRSTRSSKVRVDHVDLLHWPAKRDSAMKQVILSPRALSVLEDLAQRRLPHVKKRVPAQMLRLALSMPFTIQECSPSVILQ